VAKLSGLPDAAASARIAGRRPFQLDVATVGATLQRIDAKRLAFTVARIIRHADGAAASARRQTGAIADSAGFANIQYRSGDWQDDQQESFHGVSRQGRGRDRTSWLYRPSSKANCLVCDIELDQAAERGPARAEAVHDITIHGAPADTPGAWR